MQTSGTIGGPSNDQFYALASDAPIQEAAEECDLVLFYS